MRSVIKKSIRPLVFYGGLPAAKIAWRRLKSEKRIYILMYHRVDYSAPPFFEVVVKPEIFEKQILFLKKKYHLIDLCDLETLEADKASGKDLVVLTFDDGYRDNYTCAFPILKKHHLPATIFLTTGYIDTNRLLWHDELAWILYKTAFVPNRHTLAQYDLPSEMTQSIEQFFTAGNTDRYTILRSLAEIMKKFSSERRQNILAWLAKACSVKVWPGSRERPMLSWDEIREMSQYGVSFGSHTVSHPILSKIPVHEARREIIESKKAIEEAIQTPVNTFAYPFGKLEDYAAHIVQILKNEGFKYACSSVRGYEPIPPGAPLVLKRRGVPSHPYLFL